MTVEKQLKDGCEHLIAESADTSKGEPHMAIAQLLISAATLARTIEMTEDDFLEGVRRAIDEVYSPDYSPVH